MSYKQGLGLAFTCLQYVCVCVCVLCVYTFVCMCEYVRV
jgi:hypothetical protein